MTTLEPEYQNLIEAGKQDLKGDAVGAALEEIALKALEFLREKCKRVKLFSKVPGKDYFAFTPKDGKGELSRPVNKALFDARVTKKQLQTIFGKGIVKVDQDLLARLLYSLAISYCAATDLTKKDDKKTPGTFFEVLVGHLVSRAFGTNPQKEIKIPTLDIENKLPTDYVFDLGQGKNRIHLPVKISTRERIVQVWAHQRILDAMHGVNRFTGILICLTETNKQKDSSVIEVCLPGQWAAYQMYIGQLRRVYYLDVPEKYKPLVESYPFIQVKSFASFFREIDRLTKASPLA